MEIKNKKGENMNKKEIIQKINNKIEKIITENGFEYNSYSVYHINDYIMVWGYDTLIMPYINIAYLNKYSLLQILQNINTNKKNKVEKK